MTMQSSNPIVAIMPDKFILGALSIGDAVPALTVGPIDDIFNTPWKTDVHCVQYAVTGAGDNSFPLCRKPLLSKLRSVGCDIYANLLIVEYDTAEHEPWSKSKETQGEFLAKLDAMADDWPMAWKWSLLYFTRGGARLVYILDEPIQVDKFELKHLWLCQEFGRQGLKFDCTVSDWTRRFRLPFVIRDGVATWEEEYTETYIQQWDKRLRTCELLDGVRLHQTQDEYGEIVAIERGQPDPDSSQRLLSEVSKQTGRMTQTGFVKEAKKRLRNRNCFPCLFQEMKIAESGGRNATLYKFVGEATALLFRMPGLTPEHVYALFLPPVMQLEPDSGTPDWTRVLWDHVCRIWALEQSKFDLEVAKAAERLEEAKSLFEQVIDGMREWCVAPELNSDDENVRFGYALRRLIVSLGSNFLVINKTGYYDSMQLNDGQIIARLRILGMDELIETKKVNEDGSITDLPTQQILNRYSTIATRVVAIPEIKGAFITDMDTPGATVSIPAYSRSKNIAPLYNPDVDEWLHRLFGANYDLGIKWLSYALAWDEGPTCAFSIAGKAGSGKKMLAQALCECLTVSAMATTEDLVSQYQYGLLDSPFLIVNEGWPMRTTGMHPADKFRALVSGDRQTVNQRYKHPIELYSPVRILFTANNLDVVKMLSGSKDLSPEDRDALSIRLMHMTISDDASHWLRDRGGEKLTAVPGRRWIRGDAGQASDYIVARHFMWLYERRRNFVTGSRLLVEGNQAQEIMFDMRTGSGNTPLVMETLIHLIEQPGQRGRELSIFEGRLYVTYSAVLSYFRDELSATTKEKLTQNTIQKVFRGLVKRECKGSWVLPNKKEMGRKYWHELDCELLLQVAQRDGWACTRLERLCKEQQDRDKGIHDERNNTSLTGLASGTQSPNVVNFGFTVGDVQLVPPQVVVKQGSQA